MLFSRPVQPANCTQAYPGTSSPFSLVKQGSSSSLIGGHAMVNIHYGCLVIKRNSVSSEKLEVPYGERNIIISLSSSCTHVLTELLGPQGLCSQSPNQGKGHWEYKRVPRSADVGSHGQHLTHAYLDQVP